MTSKSKAKDQDDPKPEAAEAPPPEAPAAEEPSDFTTSFKVAVTSDAEINSEELADYLARAITQMHGTLHPSDPLTSIRVVEVAAKGVETVTRERTGPSRYAPNVDW